MPTYEELIIERDELAQRVQRLQTENRILRERLGICEEEVIVATTPTLTGKDAELFLKRAYSPVKTVSKEDYAACKSAY